MCMYSADHDRFIINQNDRIVKRFEPFYLTSDISAIWRSPPPCEIPGLGIAKNARQLSPPSLLRYKVRSPSAGFAQSCIGLCSAEDTSGRSVGQPGGTTAPCAAALQVIFIFRSSPSFGATEAACCAPGPASH